MSIMIEVAGPAASAPRLTPTEESCLHMLAEGRKPAEIGLAMSLSDRDVEDLLFAAQEKLGARNRLHAVSVAMLRGYICFGSAEPG